ncbi:MAG: metallophosphoesterase [Lactobacillaceae bacterium]|jgi:serine/threonine protein phosphatase 1|nr:metallophosphoesterase [Lactobacillaceae bacterium]
MKHYIISDIHGNFTDLQKFDNYLTDDVIPVFLGDYFDDFGKTQPLQVLDYIRDKVENHNGIALLGNHDDFWLQTVAGDERGYRNWRRNGGTQTWEDLGIRDTSFTGVREFILANLSDYTEFLASLPLTYSDAHRIYVHAGLNWQYPLSEQTREDLLWIRNDYYYTLEMNQIMNKYHFNALFQAVGQTITSTDYASFRESPFHVNTTGKVIVSGHTPTYLITGDLAMPIVKMQHDSLDVPRYVIDGGSPYRSSAPEGINLLGLDDEGNEILNTRF